MDSEIERGWATLYGILIGDGCISNCCNKYFVVVTCSIHDDQDFFDYVVVPLMERFREKPVSYRRRPKYGKIEINFSDKDLFNKLKEFGFPVGLKGNITIPQAFPKRVWRYIVAGIFATDGSLVFANNNGTLYPRVEFRSNSLKLIKQMQEFLLFKGIKGNIYRTENKEWQKPTFRLEIPGKKNLLKFKEKIGFINPKHEEKFNEFFLRKKELILFPTLSHTSGPA